MLTEQQVAVLAHAMTESSHVSRFIDVGYTYLGQFIAHDIVPQTHPIPGQSRDVLPYLNLDSVYGIGTQTAKLLDAHGLFPIKRATPQSPEDLPRTDGVPNIPELRNDDNVIVAQLHLFWQRFHNALLQRGYAHNANEARGMTTLVFQLVVVEDYLRQVLAPAVFDSVFRFDQRWLNLPTRPIAREFAHAAFRFGHSMVRPFYESFPQKPDVTLPELFQMNRNLDPQLELDFRRMFGWPVLNNRVEDAMTIDPFITREMRQVPIPAGGTINIAEMNLRAGIAAQLPPGKAYVEQLLARPNGSKLAAAFGVRPLPDLGPLSDKLPPGSGITIDNLPLWPYLLLEAVHASEGKHLGVVGSLICAEALANAIAGAQHSIYRDRWHSVDEVLSWLSLLGDELQEQRRVFANAAFTDRTFCMRHVIELVAKQLKEVRMEIPPELVDWVAHEGQEPTLVVNPCYIPPSAVDDLAFYHPGFGGGLTHALRHVLGRDDNNKYFARADSLSGNWHEKMADVMQRLRLYPTQENGRAVLIDDQIGNQPTGEMHGWKVVHWKVAKGRDTNLQEVHQDFITWTKPGQETVISLFSWRPYRTAVLQRQPEERVVNERAVLSQGSR